MPTTLLTSIDDPRTLPFRNLRDPNLRNREGLFIAEGEWILERCLKNGIEMHCVLCKPSRASTLERLVPDACPIYVLPTDEISRLVGFEFHRGVLACAKRPRASRQITAIAQGGPDTLVMGSNIANPVNLGRIARLCAGFGVRALLVGAGAADEFSRQALRVSMGAVLSLPIVRTEQLGEQIRALRNAGYTIAAATLDSQATDLRRYHRQPRTVLMLGAEDFGVDERLLAEVDDLLTISMPATTDSLNVADAASAFLYELCYRQAGRF